MSCDYTYYILYLLLQLNTFKKKTNNIQNMFTIKIDDKSICLSWTYNKQTLTLLLNFALSKFKTNISRF